MPQEYCPELMRILHLNPIVVCASLFAVLSSLPIRAQNSADHDTAVFQAETRQILVDVVVRDHGGRFIAGLKPDAFTILEDGKPQKIVAMTMHAQSATPAEPAAPLKLPPNQYTNYTVADPDRPLTLVLLDLLNTHAIDQAYARKQMIQFLRALPPGRKVALFVLGTKLKMLQGFTGDSDTLVAAAKMLRPEHSLTLTSEADRQDLEISAASLDNNTSPRGSPASSASPDSSMAAAIARALGEEQDHQQIQRMGLTLDALATLARAVSAYPGRKNLLWLSGEIPLLFGPDFQIFEQAGQQSTGVHAGDLQAQTPPIHETAALFTASQIAVYPIDIRGVVSMGTGMNISSPTLIGGAEEAGSMSTRFARRMGQMQWDDREAMSDIARETGGTAFFGTNDLKGALETSTREGENYYTIAYAPENHKWNGKYRKLELKCSATGAKLTYRRGYYAVADTFASQDAKAVEGQVAHLFATAMQPEAPASTAVLLKVQVLPPDTTHKTVRIDYAINPHDVIFAGTQENERHVTLDLMAVAWDKEGKDAGHSSDRIDSSLPTKVYAEVMRSYIPAHQELELRPGTYTLRLGVVDRSSRKIGTLDVPLTITALQSSDK
jgi:VWFA-related protein